ncbi:MAG: hypothetical protein V7752_07070 [Halopseudomonas sp.]
MKHNSALILLMLASTGTFAASGNTTTAPYTYKECLRETMQKNNVLSASDIRQLCDEITDYSTLMYEKKNGAKAPANEFTMCVERSTSKGTDVGFAKFLCTPQ